MKILVHNDAIRVELDDWVITGSLSTGMHEEVNLIDNSSSQSDWWALIALESAYQMWCEVDLEENLDENGWLESDTELFVETVDEEWKRNEQRGRVHEDS